MAGFREADFTLQGETAGDPMVKHARVMINQATGRLVIAGAADPAIGNLERDVTFDGEEVAIRGFDRTRRVLVTAAVVIGQPVTAGANGMYAPGGTKWVALSSTGATPPTPTAPQIVEVALTDQ